MSSGGQRAVFMPHCSPLGAVPVPAMANPGYLIIARKTYGEKLINYAFRCRAHADCYVDFLVQLDYLNLIEYVDWNLIHNTFDTLL